MFVNFRWPCWPPDSGNVVMPVTDDEILMKRLLFLLLALTFFAPSVYADDANDLVEDSEFVIKTLLEDTEQGAFQTMLSQAYGVLIIPAYLQAGLVWRGSGGGGSLLSPLT